MQIVGNWWLCDDGTPRPTLEANVRAADGKLVRERFLVDSGADHTVLSAALQEKLQLPLQPTPVGVSLQGVGGNPSFTVVNAVLELIRDDGGHAHIRGDFAVLTELAAVEFSLVGRDVLDHFDLIVSRRRGEVLLLGGNHRYAVAQA